MLENNLLHQDMMRYSNLRTLPQFQKYYRKYQMENSRLKKYIYHVIYKLLSKRNHIEISCETKIGEGLYIGHPYAITINPETIIGCNCNIHKGVTIGQENRGSRKGSPVIGNEVWIGVNSTVVGKIKIGNDVLIAPNSFVNCDIPSHSIVFGNPCIVKHKENATESYINRKCNNE